MANHRSEVMTLEQRLEQVLAERDQMKAEMASLRETLDGLAGRVGVKAAPLEQPTLVSEEFKRWAQLSAQEKTQLVANDLYGPSEGTKPYECQLVYLPRRSGGLNGVAETPPSEHPRVKLHAHNEPEAKALYLSLCGITSFKHDVCQLECAPVAAA